MSHHQQEEDATATATVQATLARLRAQHESRPLTILSLAEPIIGAATAQTSPSPSSSPSSSKRTSNNASDTSAAETPALTPATLASDLTHYRELFSKLRFSYLEQVTKEKYLRSIVGEPAVLVSHAENSALEEKLRGVKAELKVKKDEVDELVARMEGMAREIAGRWEGVRARMGVLEELPGVLAGVEERVRVLRGWVEEREREGEGQGREVDPRMNVGLAETEALVAEQRERGRELDRLIAAVQREALPAKMEECEAVQGELEALERRKHEVVALAAQATRARDGEGGGTGIRIRDELEYKGRWYRSAEVVMSAVVGVDA